MAEVSERGDLLELLCDAYEGLPPLSATVRSWTHVQRQQQAMEEARRLRIGGAWPLYAGKPVTETEHIEHLLLDPQKHAYRVEHGNPPGSTRYGALWLCDGTTTWTQVSQGEFLRQESLQGRRHLPSQAAPLLDATWLSTYQWDPPVPDIHGGRDVLKMRVRLSGDRVWPSQVMSSVPAVADVVIDSQLGFLHRLTGLIDGEPYRVVELLDLALVGRIEENAVTVDLSRFRVIDDDEWTRRLRGSLPRRVWRTVTLRSRSGWQVLTRQSRRRRYRPKM